MKKYGLVPAPHAVSAQTGFGAIILHPEQFRDLWGGEGTSPERELAAAVLDAAAADLDRYRCASERTGQRMFWEAYQWIASADRSWAFSFLNICELLRLEPELVRARLLGPRDATAAKAKAA
jgi:hypothetical protein